MQENILRNIQREYTALHYTPAAFKNDAQLKSGQN
jgi:hypothetical protein